MFPIIPCGFGLPQLYSKFIVCCLVLSHKFIVRCDYNLYFFLGCLKNESTVGVGADASVEVAEAKELLIAYTLFLSFNIFIL